MKIKIAKQLVSEYANNLSLLFVTNTPVEIQNYLNFFKFLFKKRNFISDSQEAFNIYNDYQDSIDLVIVHVSGDVEEFKELIEAIRKKSDEVYTLVFTTNEEERISFNLNACFCADGFIPIPFDKDNIYLYLYRFLRRIIEKKELDGYVKELESAYNDLLDIENYIANLKKIESIDKDKLIAELCNIKNKVQDNFEIEESFIQSKKETAVNRINQEKLNDIRFTQNDKMSALEFIETLDDTIIDKIEDFLEKLNEYAYTLDDLLKSDAIKSLSDIQSLTMILREFYYMVDTLTVFPVIARTFDSIIEFLNALTAEQLEDNEKKSILVLSLEGLENDLASWITHIFVDRATDNIHYLDASFANNALEMEAIFTEVAIESDEDDLEFF